MIMKLVLTAALIALATPAFAAGDIPDGKYDCTMDGYSNGTIVIAGNTYKGPDYDGDNSGTYTFDVQGGGNINFRGPVGMYADPGTEEVLGLVIYPDNKTPAIELHVKTKGSDTIHIAQCLIEP